MASLGMTVRETRKDYVHQDDEKDDEALNLHEPLDSWEDTEIEDDAAEEVNANKGKERQRHEEERPHQARSRTRQVRWTSRMDLLCSQDKKSRSGVKARESADEKGEKPRSANSKGPKGPEGGRNCRSPFGTRVPKRIARGALDAWVKEHAPASAGETWVAYTSQSDKCKYLIEVKSNEVAVFDIIMQQVSL